MTRKVDFFIVGAPKCGTDSLRDYLNMSPEVFICGPQEPNHFCPDIVQEDYSDAEYFQRFFAGREHVRFLGDKSTWLLNSEAAPILLTAYNPEAKFIALVREPVSMFLSMYGELAKNGVESSPDPETAWHRSFDCNPATTKSKKQTLSRYASICSLGRQVAMWQERIESDRLYVALMPEVIGMAEERERICRFLGISEIPSGEMPHSNQATSGGNTGVGRLLNPPKPIVKAINKAKKAVGIRSLGVGTKLVRWRESLGRIRFEKPTISDTFRAELDEYFREDIDILRKCTGRSLEGWGKTPIDHPRTATALKNTEEHQIG